MGRVNRGNGFLHGIRDINSGGGSRAMELLATRQSGWAERVSAGEDEDPRPREWGEADRKLGRSVEKGMAMLELFSAQAPSRSVARMSELLSMSRPTTYRYASTLVTLGYVEQDHKHKYRLARGAIAPGMTALAIITRRLGSRTVLELLRERAGHTVGLLALDGPRAIYVQRLHTHGQGQYAADLELRTGAQVPLHCTAAGKALLATLDETRLDALLATLGLGRLGPSSHLREEIAEIRHNGYAVSDEEHAPGVRSLAMVVPGSGPERPLAIDVTIPQDGQTLQAHLDGLAAHLTDAVQALSIAASALEPEWGTTPRPYRERF